jgi:hypothetical protein
MHVDDANPQPPLRAPLAADTGARRVDEFVSFHGLGLTA